MYKRIIMVSVFLLVPIIANAQTMIIHFNDGDIKVFDVKDIRMITYSPSDKEEVKKQMETVGKQAKKARDMSNLKQIGTAIFMYAQDHDGRTPDNLAILFKENILPSLKVYQSPASNAIASIKMLEQNEADYIYFARDKTLGSISNPSKTPLAITRPGLFQNNYVNILFADGHVEGCSDYQKNQVVKNLIGNQLK